MRSFYIVLHVVVKNNFMANMSAATINNAFSFRVNCVIFLFDFNKNLVFDDILMEVSNMKFH